jgi:large subunit ribosomal protein L23
MESVIVKPIITEKMTTQGEKLNRFGFIVDVKANKVQIKSAVEALYNVNVTDVNTMRYSGKANVRYTRKGVTYGRKNNFKKAIVTLKDGESIDFFNNI